MKNVFTLFTKKLFRTRARKIFAVFTAYTILFQAIYPTCAFALTGGPSQPEVQSFEPVGTSDMVDLFSGDFNYNIPLMDVDGYPINIAYHSGITMDQEASWVGLGWNINPGVVNRNMRGLPDDFKGDTVTKQFNMKPNRTYGINTGAGLELFGSDKLHIGLDYTLGVHYNNYTGMGIEQSLNLSLSAGKPGCNQYTAGLGITSSSDDGLSIQPSLGMSTTMYKNSAASTVLGLHVGTSFNSRTGLSGLTIGASANVRVNNGTTDPSGNPNKTSVFDKGVSGTYNPMQPTYTPEVTLPMTNLSVTANFKPGGELWGAAANWTIGGYFSQQVLTHNTIQNPAYGYLNADEGSKYENSLMDFNREKDGSFTTSTPDLPLSNFTYDIYSVSGQGAGGSYRPFRSDMGNVFNPETSTTSDGYSLGVEVGIGNLFHGGADFVVNNINTVSKKWDESDNYAIRNLSYQKNPNDPLFEGAYFKEANEKSVDSDPSFFAKQGGANAERVTLTEQSKFNTIADLTYSSGLSIDPHGYRLSRDKRNQSISFLSHSELSSFGLQDPSTLNLYSAIPGHHIGEVTSLGTDGKRYVYGIAAYNTTQEETTFAVGTGMSGGSGGYVGNCVTGLVGYTPGDNSNGNQKGVDNYFSNTIMPPFAHSYLLTAVLSPDYIDSDSLRGPSDNDMGSYTKFSYSKISNYKWRVPVQKDSATFNEGLKSDPRDDKANYLYGQKELWYVSSIETKNYIAVFTTAPRNDARGVLGKDGGMDTTNADASQLLKTISLYTKPNYKAHQANSSVPLVAIKQVHFVYDYSLCPGIPNNKTGGGKLTLKSIYFTYQGSFKGRLSPYKFTYSAENPSYNIKAYDRWGNYKPNDPALEGGGGGNPCDPRSSFLPNSEYPYVGQNKTLQDGYMTAWTLTTIDLPSGGEITVNYESDDYAYVQNKVAGQMFTIDHSDVRDTVLSEAFHNNPNYYFKLQKDKNGHLIKDLTKYFNGIDTLYFRYLVELAPNSFDYVSGYAFLGSMGLSTTDSTMAYFNFNGTSMNGTGTGSYCPVAKAAIQFGRLNNARLIWDQVDPVGETTTFGEDLLKAIINSSFFSNIENAILGPNQAIYDKLTGDLLHPVPAHCHYFVPGKSWVRLNNPNGAKLGGGARVKSVQINDNWNEMTINAESSFDYGQQYTYTLADGTSSGVASYEPQIGGDENPWKQPRFFDISKILAPDDEHYLETPFGESFFPSASVGYSLVTVKNLQRPHVHRNATGSVVHEFYTSKDFPTIPTQTDMIPQRDKSDAFGLSSIFNIDVRDYMTASEGYEIELNDMNGKPKSQKVYQESQVSPISSVEYIYEQSPYLNGSFRLGSQVTTIAKDGTVNPNAQIGVFYDYTSDFRESTTTNNSAGVMANLDGFLVFPILPPVLIPTLWPSLSNETTRFRSAVITKVVQRFGILQETIAQDLGSVVSTQNLAYDAETGETLLTQTTTDFNDPVYSLTYPAHWYYDGMGPAYKNIGFTTSAAFNSSGIASLTVPANMYFAAGDELELTSGSTSVKGWVTLVSGNTITAVQRSGLPVSGSYAVKVIRSGRKNQQVTPIAKLTTLTNPINSLQSNTYSKILQASAMQFTDSWRTYCDCYNTPATQTTNPYILGILGFWKMQTSYLYLTDRAQSNFDNNTNIRKDGLFTAYTPFYKLSGGQWVVDPENWTFTTQVTEFSPYGVELENQDALGRYSAATYGYNQAYPTSVAANSRYGDIGFDGFEDYSFSGCADNHFKFNQSAVTITSTQSHTGKRSIQVGSSTPVTMTKQLAPCVAPNPCNLTLCSSYNSTTHQFTVQVNGGTAPYGFDWNIVNGQAGISLAGSNSIFISNVTTSTVTIQLNVTDSKACVLPYTITISGTTINLPACP